MPAAVGVKLQTFNWRMWQARKAAGLTQAQLGLLTDLHAQRIGTIEQLRTRPTPAEQEEIAAALNLDIAEVFPPEVLDLYGPAAATVRLAVPATALQALRDGTSHTDPARLVSGIKEELDDVIGMLKPREQDVIRRRFGLGDETEQTYQEIGEVQHVTRERIRQIEAKALRKLRHPRYARPLAEHLKSEEDNGARVPQGIAPKVGEIAVHG